MRDRSLRLPGKCSTPVQDDGTTCDPTTSDACFGEHICVAGTCPGAKPVVCAATDDCHEVGACDSTTGACSDPAKPDGTSCSTGTCQSGTCTAPSMDAGTDADAGDPDASAAGGGQATSSSSSSSGSGNGGGGSGNGGGGGGGEDPNNDDLVRGNCNCLVAGNTSGPTAPLAAMVTLMLAVASRRRRRH